MKNTPSPLLYYFARSDPLVQEEEVRKMEEDAQVLLQQLLLECSKSRINIAAQIKKKIENLILEEETKADDEALMSVVEVLQRNKKIQNLQSDLQTKMDLFEALDAHDWIFLKEHAEHVRLTRIFLTEIFVF
jgi:hypothetical protein